MLRIESNRRSSLVENSEGKSQKISMNVHQDFSCFNGF